MTTQVAHLPEQAWLENEVRRAQADEERGIWSVREAMSWRNAKLLHRRWKDLNRVTGTPTEDTWCIAIAIGVAIAIAITIAIGWAGYGSLGYKSWPAGFLTGTLIGIPVAYQRFIAMVYRETYIEVIVNEFHSALSATSEAVDTVIAFLPRLGFYLRPDAIEGNRGETGFRDAKARIRLKTRFGQSVMDLRYARDYWDLPIDDHHLEQAHSMLLYSLIKLVRSAGQLYKSYGVPLPEKPGIERLSGIWHWIILLCGMVLTLLIIGS